jgi:proteasome lid subunit RPN8/RPN11
VTPENKTLFHEHSKRVAPREACGLLIMEGRREVLVICENRSPLMDQFEISAEDYVKAELRGEVIGVVHSHPITNPQPSEADKVACEATGLEWHILAVITGQWHSFKPSGYRAPLVGRTWAHGIMDCYSIVRDYYQDELNIKLTDFERQVDWWAKGDNLYLDNFQKAGFFEVKDGSLRKHDVILMQILSPNHAAVYLGNELILHHIHKRLSCREVYGGMWSKCTTKVVRHKSFEKS